MWGADDPFNRKPLMWKGMKFDDEYRNNFQTGKKKYDKVQFNQSQYDLYKKLISIRKTESVLNDGEIKFIITDGKKLGYEKYNDKDKIIVLFNTDTKSQIFDMDTQGVFEDLLTGKKYNAEKIKIKPLDGLILKRLQ